MRGCASPTALLMKDDAQDRCGPCASLRAAGPSVSSGRGQWREGSRLVDLPLPQTPGSRLKRNALPIVPARGRQG